MSGIILGGVLKVGGSALRALRLEAKASASNL